MFIIKILFSKCLNLDEATKFNVYLILAPWSSLIRSAALSPTIIQGAFVLPEEKYNPVKNKHITCNFSRIFCVMLIAKVKY